MTTPLCSRCGAALPDVSGKGVAWCPHCKHPNELRTQAPEGMDIDKAVGVTLAARAHGQDEGYLRGHAAGVAEERARCLEIVKAMRDGWQDPARAEHAQHVCNSIEARINDPAWRLEGYASGEAPTR